MSDDTQDRLLLTVTTPLGQDQLLFKSLQGEEQLSGLFYFQIEMLSNSKELSFDDLVGKPLTVNISFAPDYKRYFNGVITRFVQGGTFVHPNTQARMTRYHAEIRPWLWQLTLTKNCRIFQHLSVPQIIQKVFDDFGLTDYRFSLLYLYEKRTYCVQYEETAFDFVSRLMEDEGIFYFFEHTEDQHTLVIADDLSAHQPCPGIHTARFLEISNQTQPENAIIACQFLQQMTTDNYAIDDFNFEMPRSDLKTSVTARAEHQSSDMRIYEYDAGFDNRSRGEKKVDRRLESHLADYQLLEGQSHCFSFTSGYWFSLKDHPRKEFNAEYVLRRVSHSLSFDHYSNTFQAFPKEVSFRPPIMTPKPKIISPQTAIVTGPAGEEIYTDKYGRIKVQFHWDQEGKRDENSSGWIRVNQGWAGKGWGHVTIPRIGQEVIVSFLNGNPDAPLVTGAVYNAWQTVPYPLPGAQTKSTLKSNSSKGGGGYNELRFEDQKGQEEIYLQAEKDWNTLVKNDKTHHIQHDETLTVDHDRTRTVHHDEQVTIDHDRTKTIHHDEILTIDNDRTKTIHHDETLTIDNNRIKHVKNNQKETVDANKDITVGKNHNEKISKNMNIKVGKSANIKVGRSKSEFVAVTSAETVGIAKALTVGAAYQISVGAIMNETVGGVKSVQVGFSKSEVVGGEHTTKAKKILIEADEEIVLKCGGSTITLDKEGNIIIKSGSKVKINT